MSSFLEWAFLKGSFFNLQEAVIKLFEYDNHSFDCTSGMQQLCTREIGFFFPVYPFKIGRHAPFFCPLSLLDVLSCDDLNLLNLDL